MIVGHDGAGMRSGVRSAGDLLALSVRLHGIALGRPVVIACVWGQPGRDEIVIYDQHL